jgi:hypothetical protein
MIEPLDTVWISKLTSSKRRSAYHRPDRDHAVLQVTTRCGKLQLMDCKAVPEVQAALHHEPCLRCFPVRGRRQRILDLIVVSGIPDA